MVFDLLLQPHCDLHLALSGPSLTLQVFRREDDPAIPGRYRLTAIPRADCTFEFMAPHNTPGHRFDDLPTVDASGKVVATHPGVYLFQMRRGDEYIVGRLQVHQQILAWWFGNDSITTAKHDIAHAQPSIYARAGRPGGAVAVPQDAFQGRMDRCEQAAQPVVGVDGWSAAGGATGPSARLSHDLVHSHKSLGSQ
ncbi:hypothetical protein [Streptomyces sp. NBC_00019]|uniref:hypothetical protein n=1 Tax=Streptomyces sp. NBC_00019 TaxID=2975623 RepID=UPI003254496A